MIVKITKVKVLKKTRTNKQIKNKLIQKKSYRPRVRVRSNSDKKNLFKQKENKKLLIEGKG